MSLACWNCGQSLASEPLPISRHAQCEKCFEVLHCCRLCRFYDTSRPQGCDNDLADPPSVKEAANFCEFFDPKPNAFNNKSENSAAQHQLNNLFDDPSPTPDEPPSNSNPLDDLFND